MHKLAVFLSVSVLGLSLSLVVLLAVGFRQGQAAVVQATAQAMPGRQALVLAPTRALAEVHFAPTVTPLLMVTLPPPTPTTEPVIPQQPSPPPENAAPRVFYALNSVPSFYRLSNYCPGFGNPVSLRLFDWTTGATFSLSNESIASIPLAWDARESIWQGYNSAHPFDQPDDARERWKISLFLSDGRQRRIDLIASPQTPGVYYVYGFQRIDPFADASGAYYGLHPCRAFTLAVDEVETFLTTIQQYQDVVRYPGLIDGDDPRWVRGTARPLSDAVPLRSIPTTAYNDPIASISQQDAIWLAGDPAWGVWAQVKYGAVQGWVDTTQLAFLPDA